MLLSAGWLCALALALTACRPIKPPQNQIKDPTILLAAISARVEKVEAARFKEVVFEYYGEERIKVRQLILVKAPNKLRVQTRLPGSDEIINLLVSDGERFVMHKRDTNEYLTGAPTRENVNRLMPLDLSAHDVVRVMLGGAPIDRIASAPGPLKVSWDSKKGHYLLTTPTRRDGQLVTRVRHTDFAVLSVEEVDREERLVYRYDTQGWEAFESLSLPDYRRFEWPAEKIDFSVDVGETQIDVPLPDTLFEFAPPPGSRVITLGPG